MTNYIIEMMKTAGVEPDAICKYAAGNIVYPDFTAEKQIKIIRLILENGYQFDMKLSGLQKGEKPTLDKQTFANGIASITSKLMNMDIVDKEEVKEILEK